MGALLLPNIERMLFSMDELVIFSSVPMCAVIGLIMILHIAGSLVAERGMGSIAVKLIVWPMIILDAAAHFTVIFWAFMQGAEPKELLLFLMISAAVAMTAIGLKEKISKGKK